MKECAWCGDDFRGEGVVLDDKYFCGDNCRDDFRSDVQGKSESIKEETRVGKKQE